MNVADLILTEATEHKEMRPSQINSSDANVRKVIETFQSFLNPFTVENDDELYCLSYGVPAPQDVEKDLLEAISLGVIARDDFVKDRLIDKTLEFHVPVKRMKLKTFESVGIVKKVQSTTNKLVQVKAERNIFAQLVLLAVRHNIDLQRTLSFPLGPVPRSLAKADG